MIDKPSPAFEMALQEEFKRFYLAGIETGDKRGYKRGYEAAVKDLTNKRDSDKIKDASDGSYDSVSA